MESINILENEIFINFFGFVDINLFIIADSALYRAAKEYTAQRDDEISMGVSDVIEVLHKHRDGWWTAR